MQKEVGVSYAVWKYDITPNDYVDVELQLGAVILCVAAQHDSLYLWCLVNPEEDTEIRHFRVAGTGHPIEELGIERNYIGTAQMLGGTFVAHVFEVYK